MTRIPIRPIRPIMPIRRLVRLRPRAPDRFGGPLRR
jgi:hypothetical protein